LPENSFQMKYLNVYDILAIHYGIIEATGGSHGVREIGLLASAAERPAAGIYIFLFSIIISVCPAQEHLS